jgi:hypothetical protein
LAPAEAATTARRSAPGDLVLLVGPTADAVYTLPESGYILIGREAHCDIVVPDPTVSRRHAALRRRDGEDWLEDLDSRGGTFVNGVRVSEPRRLVDGDDLRLAAQHLRYRRHAPASGGVHAPTASGTRFDVERQKAGTINNVARDQYLSYGAHVQQQRASFARDIAATKTKANWLVGIGLAISVVGFVVYGQVILRFLAVVAGTMMIVVGIVLHVVAAARRRRIDEELPLPPPP